MISVLLRRRNSTGITFRTAKTSLSLCFIIAYEFFLLAAKLQQQKLTITCIVTWLIKHLTIGKGERAKELHTLENRVEIKLLPSDY